MYDQTVEIDADPAEVLKRVKRHAEMWGGAWDGHDRRSGKLGLPVSAGLRRGWVEGDVTVEPKGGGCVLQYKEDHSAYRLDRASVMILVAAALGCLVTLFAMFIPALLPVLPVGILLGIGAYLVVIARLRNSGPEEFLEAVAEDDP